MPDDENRKILNTLAKGAGITAFGMFFSKAITYFYRALVGRALGPEAYGMLNTGLMIVGIAATLSGAPVENGLKKFIPEFREKNDKASIKGMVLSSLQLNLAGSLLVGLTIFFLAEFLAVQIFENRALIPVIQVFSLVPLIGRPYDIFIETTIAYNKAKYKVISTNIVQNIVQLAVTAILIIPVGLGVMGAVYGWALAVLFTLPLAFYFMERKVGPILTDKIKATHHKKKLFNYSYPLMLSGVVHLGLGWADTALIGYFLNQSKVGIYNAAYPTALLLLIPHQAIGQLALTSLSEIKARGNKQGAALKTAARWVFALSFPTFLIMALFSSELLTLLFGSQYSSAGLALTILAFGHLVNASVGRIGDLLKSGSHTDTIFYITTGNLVVNIIINIILIPTHGITGAAVATAGSTIFGTIIALVLVWRYEKTHPFSKSMIKPIVAGLTSITTIYLIIEQLFTVTPFWVLIPAGIAFYIIYVLIFLKIGGLKQYDRDIIISLGRKIGFENETRKILDFLT